VRKGSRLIPWRWKSFEVLQYKFFLFLLTRT